MPREHASRAGEIVGRRPSAEPPAVRTGPLAGRVLALQRSHGNAAVARALAGRTLARHTPIPTMTDQDAALPSQPTEQRWRGHAFVDDPATADTETVEADDVRQGMTGDCYFLACLAAVAMVAPQQIRSLIRENGDGTYRTSLYDEHSEGTGFLGLGGRRYWYTRRDYTLNDTFLTLGGRPRYANVGDTDAAGNSELWAMLLEKAWAHRHGRSYQRISGGDSSRTEEAMSSITGQRCRSYDLDTSISDADLAARMANYRPHKHPTVAGIDSVPSSWRAYAQRLGVVQNHVYAVESVDARAQTVNLYNPWGFQHLRALPMRSFRVMFSDITMTTGPVR